MVLGQDAMNLNSPNLVEGREFDFVNVGAGGTDAGIAVDLTRIRRTSTSRTPTITAFSVTTTFAISPLAQKRIWSSGSPIFSRR